MYDRDTKNEYFCIWQNLIRDHHTEKLSVHVQIKKLFMFLRKRAGIYHATKRHFRVKNRSMPVHNSDKNEIDFPKTC